MFISYGAIEKRQVVRPGIWRLSMAGCSLCVRFGTYMVTAYALGTQGFGVLLFVQWIAALLLPLIGTGMTPLASNRIVELQYSETRHTVAGIFHLRWRQQCMRVLLYCTIYVPLTFVLSLLTGGTIQFSLLLVAGTAATPLLLSNIATTTLQGLRRHNLLAMLRFFSTLLNFCLVYGVVTQEHSSMIGMLLLVPAFTSIATLTIALICIARLLPLYDAVEPGPLLRERIEQSQHPAFLSFMIDTVVWRELLFLILILTTRHTLSIFGFYVFSLLLCTHLIEIVPTLFVTCMLPIMSHLFPARYYINPYTMFIKTFYMLALLTGTICVLISISCPLIIAVCFGSSYLPMVTPLRILLIGVAFGSVATVSLTYLTQSKRKREQMWLGIGVAVLHIGLALPCILLWGIVGAALASTVAHIVSTIGITLLCRHFLLHN